VIKVIRGNGAYLAGIRAGDIIYGVNGTEVRDHKLAIDCIERRCRMGDCEIDVQRGSRGHSESLRLTGLPSPLRGISTLRRHSVEQATAIDVA
jgi:C-terminal processing protease CtpA/Prc